MRVNIKYIHSTKFTPSSSLVAEIRQTKFLSADQACKAIFCPTPCFKQRTIDSTGFFFVRDGPNFCFRGTHSLKGSKFVTFRWKTTCGKREGSFQRKGGQTDRRFVFSAQSTVYVNLQPTSGRKTVDWPWATAHWSWPEEWNWCAWGDLYHKKKTKKSYRREWFVQLSSITKTSKTVINWKIYIDILARNFHTLSKLSLAFYMSHSQT